MPRIGKTLFNIDGKEHLVLLDESAASSGDYIKHINYLRPRVMEKVKERDLKVGDAFSICRFHFIVARKSYRNTWTAKKNSSLAKELVEDYISKNKDISFKSSEEYFFLKDLEIEFHKL